jgi:fatty acid desaturase
MIAFCVVGCCQYRLFILGHDAVHGSLHPNRELNDQIARWLIYGPMFMGLEDGRRSHLEHHRFLGTELDPDRYLHSLSNKNTKFKFLLYCSGLATFGKTVLKVTPFGKLLNYKSISSKKFSQSNQPSVSLSKALVDYLKQRVAVAVMQTVLISLFALSGLSLWSYLILWVAPIYFFVFLPDEIRAFCDHAVPIVPENLGDCSRLITFRSSWLEAIFLSPHNMNYHAEHHLWSSVPYYNLPKVHEFVKERSEVNVRKGYIPFLLTLIRSLPLPTNTTPKS